MTSGRLMAAHDNRTTRVRQVTASRETVTLSHLALEPQKQCLDRAPDVGASARCCSLMPCHRGLGSSLASGAPFFVSWCRRGLMLAGGKELETD